MYAMHKDQKALEAALQQARGTYQRDLLLGREAISGATLCGKARDYGPRYKESAENLLARCRAAGVPVSVVTAAHGKRVIVVG